MGVLLDKVAIVTGGASGIGFETAKSFSKEGAKVVIWDVQEEKGKEAVASIIANGGQAAFYLVNTASFEATEAAAKAVMADFGKIDILINNAGITRDATLAKLTPEDWQKVLDVNLTGVFNCSKSVSGYMVSAGSGRIINTSSVVHYMVITVRAIM